MGEALVPGTIFADRYRIVGQIGTGGFGAVHAAVHEVTGRKVALKVLWPQFASEPQFRNRFMVECRLAAQIGSEFIVDVLDAGIDAATDMPFLVMELLRGESLSARIARKRTLNAEETITYLSQVAVALDRTHAHNIVHRDLKPANLFLTERADGAPLVKILDFGIAKVVATSALEAVSNTLGTPLYMAPEQFNQSAATPSTDLYALALIAFRFLAGAHYFRLEQARVENVYQLAQALASGPQEPATVRAKRYRSALPAAFDPWFARAANASPSHRFAFASEAIGSLCDALGLPNRPALLAPERPKLTGALSFVADSLGNAGRAMEPKESSAGPFSFGVGDRVTAAAVPEAPASAATRRDGPQRAPTERLPARATVVSAVAPSLRETVRSGAGNGERGIAPQFTEPLPTLEARAARSSRLATTIDADTTTMPDSVETSVMQFPAPFAPSVQPRSSRLRIAIVGGALLAALAIGGIALGALALRPSAKILSVPRAPRVTIASGVASAAAVPAPEEIPSAAASAEPPAVVEREKAEPSPKAKPSASAAETQDPSKLWYRY